MPTECCHPGNVTCQNQPHSASLSSHGEPIGPQVHDICQSHSANALQGGTIVCATREHAENHRVPDASRPALICNAEENLDTARPTSLASSKKELDRGARLPLASCGRTATDPAVQWHPAGPRTVLCIVGRIRTAGPPLSADSPPPAPRLLTGQSSSAVPRASPLMGPRADLWQPTPRPPMNGSGARGTQQNRRARLSRRDALEIWPWG